MISVYTFLDAEGCDTGLYNTQDYDEAKAYAREHSYRIVAQVYEWDRSEECDDYTGNAEREGIALYHSEQERQG